VAGVTTSGMAAWRRRRQWQNAESGCGGVNEKRGGKKKK